MRARWRRALSAPWAPWAPWALPALSGLSARAVLPALLTLLAASPLLAQFQAQDETPYFGWSSPTGGDHDENTLFEARPRLNLTPVGWFDLLDDLENRRDYRPKIELVFDPQLRMFNSTSVPVRMPSYRIFPSVGVLKIWYPRGAGENGRSADAPHHFSSLSLDHGHYSNGQEGCAFAAGEDDESPACDSAYAALDQVDLRESLNRRSGEFSTNFVRVKAKHLWVRAYSGPRVRHAWEFAASYTRLVDRLYGIDLGGYADRAPEFYPMNQFGVEVASHWTHPGGLLRFEDSRLGLEAWIKPSRAEAVAPYNLSVFGQAFWANGFGLGLKYEQGQDAYNVRLVDDIRRVLVSVVLRTDALRIERPVAE